MKFKLGMYFYLKCYTTLSKVNKTSFTWIGLVYYNFFVQTTAVTITLVPSVWAELPAFGNNSCNIPN